MRSHFVKKTFAYKAKCDQLPKEPHVDDEECFSNNCCADSEDQEYREVQSFGSLYVGREMKGGRVAEITPGIDEFTVTSSAGGRSVVKSYKFFEEH